MLAKRLVVSLEIRDGRAVQRTAAEVHEIGEPLDLAARCEADGADEIAFFDTSETVEGRRMLLDLVERSARRLFIPLTVGGGIHEVGDVELALAAGADKVSINTAAVQRPAVITEAAVRFGTHCIVASVDTRMEKRSVENAMRSSVAAAGLVSSAPPISEWYRVYTHGGSTPTMLDAIAWCKQCAELGAGEIMLTSMDQNGGRAGFDLELTGRVVEASPVPVLAGGTATSAEHVRDVFMLAGADGALMGVPAHAGGATVAQVKQLLVEAGLPVRIAATA